MRWQHIEPRSIACIDCGKAFRLVTNKTRCRICQDVINAQRKWDDHVARRERQPKARCVDCGAELSSRHHMRCKEHRREHVKRRNKRNRLRRLEYTLTYNRSWHQQNNDYALNVMRDRYLELRNDPKRWEAHKDYRRRRYALRKLLSDPARFKWEVQQQILALLSELFFGPAGG